MVDASEGSIVTVRGVLREVQGDHACIVFGNPKFKFSGFVPVADIVRPVPALEVSPWVAAAMNALMRFDARLRRCGLVRSLKRPLRWHSSNGPLVRTPATAV